MAIFNTSITNSVYNISDRFSILDNQIKGLNKNYKENKKDIIDLKNEYQKDKNNFNEVYTPTIDWYKENREEFIYMYDTVSEFYMSMALNPIIRFLNYFFHWFYLQLVEYKYDYHKYRIFVRPCISKFCTGVGQFSSYTSRKAGRKKCYKRNMKIFKKLCKENHIDIKNTPIMF